jgi:hypothetical protein
MTTRPHDVSDLFLAPVILDLDAKLDELGKLAPAELAYQVALESDTPDSSRQLREMAVLRMIERQVETHNWALAWDPRGLRVSHDGRVLVLGVPPAIHDYLRDRAPR